MIKFFVYFIATLTFIFAENTPPKNIKENIINIIKAELSQKLTTVDFDVDLDHWSAQWEDEVKDEDTLQTTALYIQPNQSRFQVEITGFKSPKKIYGKIKYNANIPVLNRFIPLGDEIQESDVIIQNVQVDQLSPQFINDKESLVGKTPKYAPLKPGIPVLKNQLQSPVIIKKGTMISVIFERKTLRIENKGIALKDASKLDVIPFEIIASDPKQPKKIIYASIESAQHAKIQL